MTKNTTFTAPGYTSPSVKIIEMKSQHVLCTSPSSFSDWGGSGEAGDGFGEGGSHNL